MSLSTAILKTLERRTDPVCTSFLISLHASRLSNARSRVWAELRELERKGFVRRAYRSYLGTKWVATVATRVNAE